jgi:hypothetical protein
MKLLTNALDGKTQITEYCTHAKTALKFQRINSFYKIRTGSLNILEICVQMK